MRTLLSLCNQQRTADQGALLFDFTSKTGEWIPVGTGEQIMGTRGICVDGNRAYIAYTVGWYETHVSCYELSGGTVRLRSDHTLPDVKDPHSLCLHEGRLLVASTGSDEILAYRLDGGLICGSPEVVWRASSASEDTHHVNSVHSDGTRVLISAFGPRSGEFWSSSENGYIYDITAGRRLCEGLRHPHSVRMYAERIYFTESSRQVLRAIDEKPVIVGGYVRGCDVASESTVLVGSNAARRISRSRGVVTNSANVESVEGEPVGKCTVARVTLGAVPKREYYDVSAYGTEIYDICVLH